jgi:hypothetical protein
MTIRQPPAAVCHSLNPKDYPNYRVVVFGSRHWQDKKYFHEKICDFLSKVPAGSPVLFISGAASSGADREIIYWCKRWGYPCLEMPADWEGYKDKLTPKGKNPAGMVRNREMAEICTHGIGFITGDSPGSNDMMKLLESSEVNWESGEEHIYLCKLTIYHIKLSLRNAPASDQ